MDTETESLLAALNADLRKLVEQAREEGREDALEDVRQLVGGARPAKRKPGPPPRRKKKKKAPSATANGNSKAQQSPEARAKTGSAQKDIWAKYTPEQRAERIRKMLAGRGVKPKAER